MRILKISYSGFYLNEWDFLLLIFTKPFKKKKCLKHLIGGEYLWIVFIISINETIDPFVFSTVKINNVL